jgi:hypothetical protein
MGIVVDVVVGFSALVIGVDNVAGKAKRKVKADFLQWEEKDKGKDNGSYSAGSSQRIIVWIVPVFEVRRYVGYHNTQYIQADIVYRSGCSEIGAEKSFDSRSEKIQRDHVHQQVHVVLVDESRREEAIVLLVSFYDVGIHDQVAYDRFLFPGVKADEDREGNEPVSDEHDGSNSCNNRLQTVEYRRRTDKNIPFLFGRRVRDGSGTPQPRGMWAGRGV